MKRFVIKIKLIYFILIFFLLNLFLVSIYAATINFSTDSVDINSGDTFSVKIEIDPEGENIRGADIYINYDSAYLQVESVQEEDYFPTVVYDKDSPGVLYIAGIIEDAGVSRNQSGTVATVTFKALKDGSTDITLDCSSSKVVKDDIDMTNVLNCDSNPSLSLVIGNQETKGGGDSVDNDNVNPTQNNNSTISELPKSGIFDNFQDLFKKGILFLSLGLALRFLIYRFVNS